MPLCALCCAIFTCDFNVPEAMLHGETPSSSQVNNFSQISVVLSEIQIATLIRPSSFCIEQCTTSLWEIFSSEGTICSLTKTHHVVFANKQRKAVINWDVVMKYVYKCELQTYHVFTDRRKPKIFMRLQAWLSSSLCAPAPGSLRAPCPVESLCTGLSPHTAAGWHLQRF